MSCGCSRLRSRVPGHVLTGSHNEVKLWSLCGPGDDAAPVITIMLEGED